MATPYILIAAILILGGVIATVGDRIGTRVGKARLSLFNLRPRKTAVLVTIMTGTIIAASTLGILFAADKQLRTGIFELEKIQKDLRKKRRELDTTRQQLDATTQELAQARADQKAQQIEAQKRQAQAQKRLKEINQSLQAAIAKQVQTQAQLSRTQAKQAQTQAQLSRTQAKQAQTQAQLSRSQSQLSVIISQFQQAQARLKKVLAEATARRIEIQQLQSERQQLIAQRNEVKAQIAQRDAAIAQLDEKIAQRDRDIEQRDTAITQLDEKIAQRDRDIEQRDTVIAQRENRLKQLETQQEFLEREVAKLEQSYQVLRLGNVAVSRGDVLAAGVVRIVPPSMARQAIEQILREANRNAMALTQPGIEQVNEQIIKISQAEVEKLITEIDDGREYVIQIISSSNYVLGEKPIQVFAAAARNQIVFRPADVLAAISANPSSMTGVELQQRLELLLRAAKFRANSSGILGNTIQIGDNRIQTLIRFFEQLRQYNQAVELQAVAAELTYTAGPLKVELIAVQNGQVIFSTTSANRQLIDALKEPSVTGSPTPGENSLDVEK